MLKINNYDVFEMSNGFSSRELTRFMLLLGGNQITTLENRLRFFYLNDQLYIFSDRRLAVSIVKNDTYGDDEIKKIWDGLTKDIEHLYEEICDLFDEVTDRLESSVRDVSCNEAILETARLITNPSYTELPGYLLDNVQFRHFYNTNEEKIYRIMIGEDFNSISSAHLDPAFLELFILLYNNRVTGISDFEYIEVYQKCAKTYTPYRNDVYQLLKSVDKVPKNTACNHRNIDPSTFITKYTNKNCGTFSSKCVYSAVAELKWFIRNFPNEKIYQDSIEFDNSEGEIKRIHYCYFYYNNKTFVYFRDHQIKFCDEDCCTPDYRVKFVCLDGKKDSDKIGDVLADYEEG